jgi:hypothetical protein
MLNLPSEFINRSAIGNRNAVPDLWSIFHLWFVGPERKLNARTSEHRT